MKKFLYYLRRNRIRFSKIYQLKKGDDFNIKIISDVKLTEDEKKLIFDIIYDFCTGASYNSPYEVARRIVHELQPKIIAGEVRLKCDYSGVIRVSKKRID